MPGIYWLLGPLVALAMVAPVRAADAWVAADVHGSVLALIAGQWLEIKRGDAVDSGVAVRTLQAGSLVLKRGGETLRLGHDTTIRPSVANGSVTVEQYSGVLSMLEPDRGSARLVTPGFIATPAAASLVSHVAAGTATLRVRSGAVQVAHGSGRLLVTAGETYSPQESLTTTPSDADAGLPGDVQSGGDSGTPGSAAVQSGAGAPAGSNVGSGNSGKQDNGVGNGGTLGNGGQNGNAGGNGNSGQHKGESK